MQYNANAGIQLSMPLYNQTILAAIDVAKTVEKINSLSYEKAVEDLTMQISKVYYMAQASQEQERLTNENILRMEELCNITEALHQQGVVMEVGLNRVRINLKSLQAQHNQSRTLHSQQLNMLRFLMDMAPETSLEVTHMAENIKTLPATGVSGGGGVAFVGATKDAGGTAHQNRQSRIPVYTFIDRLRGGIGLSGKVPVFLPYECGNGQLVRQLLHRLVRKDTFVRG